VSPSPMERTVEAYEGAAQKKEMLKNGNKNLLIG